MNEPTIADRKVSLRRVTAATVGDVCDLSETLTELQRNKVADNAVSIAEAHFSESAWFRAVYCGEELAGFVMLHIGSDELIDYPGAFLWRLMIAGPFQGKGIGREVIALLVREVRGRGMNELRVSYGQGPGSPEAFYRGLGFVPTGDVYDDEIEAALSFAAWDASAASRAAGQ